MLFVRTSLLQLCTTFEAFFSLLPRLARYEKVKTLKQLYTYWGFKIAEWTKITSCRINQYPLLAVQLKQDLCQPSHSIMEAIDGVVLNPSVHVQVRNPLSKNLSPGPNNPLNKITISNFFFIWHSYELTT